MVPPREKWLINILSPSLIIVNVSIVVVSSTAVAIITTVVPVPVDVIIAIICIALWVTSVLVKNMSFQMFFKSQDCSCFLNIFRDAIPDQWSHYLNHLSSIVIVSSFGMESK